MVNDKQQAIIEKAVRDILGAVGEDPDRPGLKETPARVARMYQEIFSGLTEPEFSDYKLFDSRNQEDMVLVKDIHFYSMCEHHLLPFFGKVHIAYIPDGQKVLGLSKLPRLVDYCAKRPSVQEDLTVMIAENLEKHIPVKGIAVAIEAEHMCMAMRGVKSPNSLTKTFHYRGIFKEELEAKHDFLRAIEK
ncbi:GTP cyclohydrolase I FolE [Enterococcus sp. BWB1-3]|uniref:GTP cyclohydrolase I FolE n=1 Tax=unclassified Enterococcus TaxID=2608891 RepID=UPI001922552B|nr:MULTISPECIES: GTP cyclohydrolase I FolE [unclassified Enterococcus]MBL1228231.1 GTP cyclohydrolase I FolE [Enterococcus sp. BWB1-3]MCB5951455.1 GTP cyclohydrolase I FolE [Enterococcus sp. BWT-B8]